MDQWQPYLIAFVIGFLVGIEREKAQPQDKSMGVRTFLLISLLGAIAGGLQNNWLALLMTAFAFSLIAISYFNQTSHPIEASDRGLTTEFAAGLIFALGFLAHESPTLSAIGGTLVAMILLLKKPIHQFTASVKPSELEAALFILLSGIVVVDFVPDKTIDPWGVLNPKKFAYLVLILAALEFLSYVTAKIIGEKKGSLISGFLGGFVSSTAILLSSAKQATKAPQNWRPLVSSALAAKIASLVQLFFIVWFVSPELLSRLLIPVGASLIFAVLGLVVIVYKTPQKASAWELRSPLDWRGVFRLAVILAAILVAISLVKNGLGDEAAIALAFLTGLFELHGVSLANATMFNQGQISEGTAILSILLAIAASLLAKIGIAWLINRNLFAKVLSLIFMPMIALLFVTNWLIQ